MSWFKNDWVGLHKVYVHLTNCIQNKAAQAAVKQEWVVLKEVENLLSNNIQITENCKEKSNERMKHKLVT